MAIKPVGTPVVSADNYAKLTPEQKAIIDGIANQRKLNPNDDLYDANYAKQQSTPTTNNVATPPTTVKAPTFDANSYYNNGAGGINNIVDKRKELQLAQLKASKDKAEADINFQKGKLPGQYQPLRDDTDFQSKVAALKLKEMMGEKGLLNSGTNVTGQMRINAANINALNTLNAQQQSQVDEFDRRIADIRNPADENAMAGQFELERLQLLNDLQTRADDRSYDNSWKTADFDYRTGRDAVTDNQWQTTYDYNKGQDTIRNNQWQTQFDYGKSQDTLANSWKSRDWNRQTEQDKLAQVKDARDFAEQQRQFNLQYALSKSKGSGGGRGGGSKSVPKWKYDLAQEGKAMGVIQNRIGSFRTAKDFDAQLKDEVLTGKFDPAMYDQIHEYLKYNFDADEELPTWKNRKVSGQDAFNMRR